MKYFIGLLMIFITGCTYSITQVHTEGTASDVVDEDQKADPYLEIPVKPL